MNEKSLISLVKAGDIINIKIYLENGGDPNIKTITGWTGLITAVRQSNIPSNFEIVKILLENGADPNIKSNDGWTALMLSARYNNTESNLETVKLLLENGADPNIKNNDGWTALMLSSRNSNTESNFETVKLLLENGADPNIKKNDGWTALIMAARNSNTESNLETVKLLLENGADPNIKDIKGWSALIYATRYSNTDSNIETVKLLLKNGADSNLKTNDGYTALTAAVFYTNPDIVKLLLDYEADPFIKLIPNMQMPKENEKILAEYQWKRLYGRDKDTARRYSKQTGIPADVWEIILLNKRQQLLCQNLSSDKNKEILFLFALDMGVPVTEDMTKAKLCGLISRHIVYRNTGYEKKGLQDMEKAKNNILKIARMYNIDTNKSLQEIMNDLSRIIQ